MLNTVQNLINGLALGSVYAMIAIGFALIFNVLKFSNFSHGGVMGVSAYIGFILANKFEGISLIWILIITGIIGGLIAVIIDFIGFRRLRKSKKSVLLYFVSSITIGILLQNILTIFFSSTFYSYPAYFKPPFFAFAGLTISYIDVAMLGVAIISIIALMIILKKTKIGIAIRALSMDENTTSLMGVNVTLVIGVTFFVSGVFGALAGVFLGVKYILYPQIGDLIVKGFMASVLGGLGNISGAVIGALLIGVLEIFLISTIGSVLTPAALFILMIVFLLIRPQGISGKSIIDKA